MVNVNKHKDKANDTERNTAMRAKMKNNYKNIIKCTLCQGHF